MPDWGTREQAEQVAMLVRRYIDAQWGPHSTVGDVFERARGGLVNDRHNDRGSDIWRDADYYLCARSYTARHKILWPIISGAGFQANIVYNEFKAMALAFDYYAGGHLAIDLDPASGAAFELDFTPGEGHPAGQYLQTDRGNPNSLPGGFMFFIVGVYDGFWDFPDSTTKPTVPIHWPWPAAIASAMK